MSVPLPLHLAPDESDDDHPAAVRSMDADRSSMVGMAASVLIFAVASVSMTVPVLGVTFIAGVLLGIFADWYARAD